MQSRRGVLLMEVMVAIVVITAGLLFVMRVYSTAKEVIARSRTFFKCSLLLEEKAFDFEERDAIEEGEDQGRFSDPKDCLWESSAYPIPGLEEELKNLYLVKLGVYCSTPSPSNKYYLYTYIEKAE